MPYAHSDSQPPLMHAPAPDVKTREKLEGGKRFVMHTEFSAAGDQPTAIAELSAGIAEGEQNQVLLGATGTGKTFTMAFKMVNLMKLWIRLRTSVKFWSTTMRTSSEQ